MAPEVADFIVGSDFKKPVYMITGVKIARGADVALARSKEGGTHIRAGVDGTPAGAPTAAGSEITITMTNSEKTSFGESSDLVFAYRLRELYYEKGQVKHKEHKKGALQGIDDGSTGETEEETPSVPSLVISGLAEEDVSGEQSNIGGKMAFDEDDEEECYIVAPKGQPAS